MSKELDAWDRLGQWYTDNEQHCEDIDTIEKALKVLEIINNRGIKLIIPEGTFSKEHIDIQLFTNTLSKDEFELIKEVLDL